MLSASSCRQNPSDTLVRQERLDRRPQLLCKPFTAACLRRFLDGSDGNEVCTLELFRALHNVRRCSCEGGRVSSNIGMDEEGIYEDLYEPRYPFQLRFARERVDGTGVERYDCDRRPFRAELPLQFGRVENVGQFRVRCESMNRIDTSGYELNSP